VTGRYGHVMTQPPSGAQWIIESGGHRAVIVEVGGGLREYAVDGADVLFGYAVDQMCPSSAGKVLVPWPNRIRDGRYSFGGEVHQLALTEPARHNAGHGLATWERWRLVATTGDSVTVEMDVVPQPGYRWPLTVRTAWTVGADGLTAKHTATNAGPEPCPFGLGTHPYVFTEPRVIGAQALDTAFGDLERDSEGGSAVTMTAPDGRGVEVWADDRFNWWQVFTGDTLPPARHRQAVAVEPMTCPPDAFRSGRDLVTLQPGATWTGSWGIRPSLTSSI
jgi:aldose 1-epimerase